MRGFGNLWSRGHCSPSWKGMNRVIQISLARLRIRRSPKKFRGGDSAKVVHNMNKGPNILSQVRPYQKREVGMSQIPSPVLLLICIGVMYLFVVGLLCCAFDVSS